MVVGAVEHLTPGEALDLGCGSGELALALAQRGWLVTALDRNPDAIERTRSRFAEAGRDVTLLRMDVATFEPAPFDLVVNSYALPPAAERDAALEVCARAVAPGGTLLIVDWDRSMAERMPMLRAADLPSLYDLQVAFSSFKVVRAELVTVPGEPGEQDGTSLLFMAQRPEG